MLTMPWPLSRLFPSSVRIGLSLWPGDVKEASLGLPGGTYTPGAGSMKETVFMPTSSPAASIFSDVISWPSNTTPNQTLPATIPSSPPAGSAEINVLDETYWNDNVNEGSYTVDGETQHITAPDDFNLYPDDIIADDAEIESITIDFETSETIGTVNIIQQNVDEPAEEHIIEDTCSSDLNWEGIADATYAGQGFFTIAQKSRITAVAFRPSLAAGDISAVQYRAEIWTVEDNAGSHDLVSLLRSSVIRTGDNDWARTWVNFTFNPPVIITSGVNYAILFHRITDLSVNKTELCARSTPTIDGWAEVWNSTKVEAWENVGWDFNINITYTDVSAEETIQSFSDVTSGQKLTFTIGTLKNMFIQFINPSNEAEGIKVTGFTAETYDFSTG